MTDRPRAPSDIRVIVAVVVCGRGDDGARRGRLEEVRRDENDENDDDDDDENDDDDDDARGEERATRGDERATREGDD